MFMIFFQLPNGKGVYLTVEQLLNLSENDVQGLVADDAGTTSNNPFRKLSTPTEDYDNDALQSFREDCPDMLSDGDDNPFGDIDINQIPDS